MASLEQDYSNRGSLLKAFFGSVAVTAGIFLAIASTRIPSGKIVEAQDSEAPLFYVPPPAPPSQNIAPQPMSSKASESPSIEFAFDDEPAEISLDLLDIPLEHDLKSKLSLGLDLDRKFMAVKPSASQLDGLVIFEKGQVDQIPYRMFAPEPRVPYSLQKLGAKLIVLYIVTKKGRAENIHVLDSSHEQFNEIAKSAIKRWRFKPALKAGEPVNSWVQHTFSFEKGSGSPFSLN